jgi:hypothetical protein
MFQLPLPGQRIIFRESIPGIRIRNGMTHCMLLSTPCLAPLSPKSDMGYGVDLFDLLGQRLLR